MNSVLLICESLEDARCLLDTEELPLPLKEIDIISMEPEIKCLLGNHEIYSKTSAEFINRLDYEIIDSDCKKVYSDLEFNIKQNIPSCNSKCIENMFLYYTFFSFYTIIWNARLLQNLLELHQYAKIITFTSKKNVESSPWFTSGQNILHLLISQVLLNKTFEHVILKNDGGEKKKHVSSFFLPLVRQFIKPAYLILWFPACLKI
jgi:ATP-dependent helicase YprA (DUF1998 family)